MDMPCSCCGEPWEIDHVLHEEPEEFRRKGCLITACPSCGGKEPVGLTKDQREYLKKVRVLAELSGDDLDGFAADLDDFGYVGLL